jgi:hypothetical protein
MEPDVQVLSIQGVFCMKKNRFHVLLMVLLLAQLTALNAQQTNLFTIDLTTRSRMDAVTPINQSVEEWAIQFDVAQVTLANKQLTLPLPAGKTPAMFTAIQTTTRLYDNGNFQWAGQLQDPSAEPVGEVIINVIDGDAYGLIFVSGLTFEIYSHSALGTRLARTESKAATLNDTLVAETETLNLKQLTENEPEPPARSHMQGGVVPGVSVIDVLVVIDDDLNYPGSPIFGKIQNEQMNADYILANSGPNGVGVPVRLNLLPYQYIDVPPQYQNITFNSNTGWEAYNYMVAGGNPLSDTLQQMREDAQADYLALYIPFDPDVLGQQACGKAEIPRYHFQDLAHFMYSFTLHASTCNADQFVLLHELVHNFGSAHKGGENWAFEPYARGYNITGSVDGDFSTLMACTIYAGEDPSETDCNRIPHLSSPEVMVSGQPIGRWMPGNPTSPYNADNVRFLTECAGYDPVTQVVTEPCRRYQMANKRSGSNPVDSAPSLVITSPTPNQIIQPTNGFLLAATAADDYGFTQANWTITDLGTNPPMTVMTMDMSVVGTQPNINWNTPALNVPGHYLISATVTDIAGQQVSDSRFLTVDDDDVPVVTISIPGEGQYFPVGQQVNLWAQVVDDNPIGQVNWTVYYENLNQPIESGIGTGAHYSYVTLPMTDPGHYLIEAAVVDSSGQEASVLGSFNIDAEPVVIITNPVEKYYPTGQPMSLQAQVIDDFPISEVTWTVYYENLNQPREMGTGNDANYTYITQPLTEPGLYLIRASVIDSAGQSTTVYGDFSIDAKPVVSITSPQAADLLVATGGSHTLTADASDDRGVIEVLWEVVNAYTDEVIDSGLSSRAQFSFNTDALTETGHYVIKATAFDVLGQSNEAAIIIELIAAADIQSQFSYYGKNPLLKATVSNTGNITAQDVMLRFSVNKKPSVLGQAEVSQIPAGCYQVDLNALPFADETLINRYECQLSSLGAFDFELNWDHICLSSQVGSLDFSTELLSINGESIPGTSSNSNIAYTQQMCNY